MIASVLTPVLSMHLDLGTIIDKVILFVTVASFGALFLVVGTTKTLRDTNADLRAQHEDDKERIGARDKELGEMRKQQAEMEGRIAVLEGLVTGAVNWTAISDQLEQHHREAVAHWQRASLQAAKVDEIHHLLTTSRDAS